MLSKKDYFAYQKSICPIPDWIEKYLSLDIMDRLKNISLLCGMEYGSQDIYHFKFYISRFDHSLSTALITWKLTHDKVQTLAALFHDVSSAAFSHVIDYMNGDYINQESTEGYTEKIINNCEKLNEYLDMDSININDIIDFKKYSIVDLKRPCMCADRLDNVIASSMNWAGILSREDAIKIITNVDVCINEFGDMEIMFTDLDAANKYLYVNDVMNKLTNSAGDIFMMDFLAGIIKKCIEFGFFTYDELYTLTESEIVDIIEENLDYDPELTQKWQYFRTIKEVPNDYETPKVKNRYIKPIVNKKRLVI